MELVWDDPPAPDGPFFTRDFYDKYSLAPNIREIWTSLQRPAENSTEKQGSEVSAAEAPSSPTLKDAAEFKGKSCISSQERSWDSADSEASCAVSAEGTPDRDNARKTKGKRKQIEVTAAYPEPRLPFPFLSNLSSKEQRTYVGYLMSKKSRSPPQRLKTKVDNEVMQFMTYLQDVAKICAEDYNFMSPGALQYTEELFMACLEDMKTLPQCYQIHEMTSLTGGMFNPGLALTFEKQLLIMGNVSITDHKIVPADAQLASDYQSVSSGSPPAKKAKDMHAMIMNDGNAEKLCGLYEPHVCLTRDALFRLLDNHGPDFGDQWELPVTVKLSATKVNSQRKIVYIDPPLLKTEIPVRERSLLFHEESLKLSFIKKGSRKVFHLMTERPVEEQQLPPASVSQRSCASLANSGLDFEMDLIDLETFGETTTTKKPPHKETQSEKEERVKTKILPGSPLSQGTKRPSEHPLSPNCSPQKKEVLSDVHPPKTEPCQSDVSEVTKSLGRQSRESVEALDSDEEKLIIDDLGSPAATLKEQDLTSPSPSIAPPAPESVPATAESSSPHKGTRSARQSKRGEACGDQLSEILRMQSAMFKSGCDTAAAKSSRCVEPAVQPHQTSLVKPCVTSYLERQKNDDGETCGSSHKPSVNISTAEHKKILSQDLQACAEDEEDYEAPAEGNVFYKLYSLQELLLLVRSSVSLTHSRHCGSSQNQFVPVHVLPKLEFQLCHGVECLTSSEACQLWTESLLHSNTVSYIAHINALTSKVALLRKLPDDWKHKMSCWFKPSKSLNILHHLLKKLTGLQEGQYMVAHKAGEPFVTILKATKGGPHNLQQVHNGVPQPPSSGHMPWIPVDPAVVLPFHHNHGRVPCTFPPKPLQQTSKGGAYSQKNNQNKQGNKNNKSGQKKRKKKRNLFMGKLLKKSV
ncbi:little elongation complex subunit 2 [Oryzias latipes]|uniref:little elongation complex subunit 2 n=1 Tax=Oryzias latipes TaxID=8090 RepID=UPI0002A47B56|nr:little elongation complex subunit 2 [Oryzias latipes]